MLKFRIISFPLLLALLAAVVFWQPVGSWAFLILIAPVALMAARELTGLLVKSEVPVYRYWTIFLTPFAVLTFSGVPAMLAALSLGGRWGVLGALLTVPVFASISLFFLPLLLSGNHRTGLLKLSSTLGAMVMLTAPMAALTRLYFEFGARTFLMLVLVTKAGDTGGYVFGRLSNVVTGGRNHPIVPTISPHKSWEGTCGGMLFSVAVALLFCALAPQSVVMPCSVGAFYWPVFAEHLPSVTQIGLAVLTGVVLYWGGFAGDLAESCIKRAAGVKDSGKCIPGMGGVLDVLDSFLFNAPLWFLLVQLNVFFRF